MECWNCEATKQKIRCLFTPSFNRAIKIRQRDSRLTSYAGAIILRESDYRLGLIESVVERMLDPRNQDKIRYTLSELPIRPAKYQNVAY